MKNGAFDLATNMLKKGDGKNKLVSPGVRCKGG